MNRRSFIARALGAVAALAAGKSIADPVQPLNPQQSETQPFVNFDLSNVDMDAGATLYAWDGNGFMYALDRNGGIEGTWRWDKQQGSWVAVEG